MSEKTRRMFDESEDRLSRLMRDMHDRGELRHLHGRPLGILEEDPEQMAARMLKQEGFSHPLLERRRDVEQQAARLDDAIRRLRARRGRLLDPQTRTTSDMAHAFCHARTGILCECRKVNLQVGPRIR